MVRTKCVFTASGSVDKEASSAATRRSFLSDFIPFVATTSQSYHFSSRNTLSSAPSSTLPFTRSFSWTRRSVRSSCTRRFTTLQNARELIISRRRSATKSFHSGWSLLCTRARKTHSSTETSNTLSFSITPSLMHNSAFMEFWKWKGKGVHRQWLTMTRTSCALRR